VFTRISNTVDDGDVKISYKPIDRAEYTDELTERVSDLEREVKMLRSSLDKVLKIIHDYALPDSIG
jgi:vacuolar-type H+-ATPase subunit I/STV1